MDNSPALLYDKRMQWLDIFSHIIWRPGIGDATWSGWFTLLLYYGTALLALSLWHRPRSGPQYSGLNRHGNYPDSLQETGRWVYGAAALLLALLGIARQSGFLRWFTALGRNIAWEYGWYTNRTLPQQQMIHLIYWGSLCLFLGLAWLNRRALSRHGALLAGLVFLLGFVSVRAVSLHSMDILLTYRRIAGFRLGTVLEIGTLLFIAAALLASHLRRLCDRLHSRHQGTIQAATDLNP